jgi:hypothetical protein
MRAVYAPLQLTALLLANCGAPENRASPWTAPPSAASVSSHWSLVAPERPAVPEVEHLEWVHSPIDQFVLSKLEQAGIEPAPAAEKAEILRRLTLDLTGLPPTPDDVSAFEADTSDDAYDRQVERLLEDPAFGEQRAHYWLDVARYADTHGYHRDNYRSAWPYRDYVIDAFASGKPFDEFTIEQLAGDLLPHTNVQQRIATGFIRAAMSTSECGVEDDEYAAIYARDRVETLASAWMGLTVGCAACHDHKYDPISQRDFYALTAFFRNSTQPVRDDNRDDAPPTVRVPGWDIRSLVTAEKEGEPSARLLAQGRYDLPGETVHADVPACLPALGDGEPRNRLGLARWLMRADHPLTARVTVNRFWSELFGAGLVRTPNDFGKLGAAPTHPELLDWLAVEFRESGWDVKQLFRWMVTSATYRQSARATGEQRERDPDNELLSRGPRFRMDAEMVRDLALSASDLLVRSVGGPSVKPYQPPNVWDVVSLPESDTSEYEQDTGDALYRRSVYIFWKRQAPPPALEVFNAPSREQSVVQRERTNTPLQALVAMNDVQLVEAARVLAAHACQAENTSEGRLSYMMLRVLSREPSADESRILLGLEKSQRAVFEADSDAVDALLHNGETPAPDEIAGSSIATWTLVANTILNMDEALSK